MLCPRPYHRGAKLYAGWILEHSAHFEVDPFTVAALAYYRSNCRARFSDNGNFGLSAINLKMHAGYLEGRVYQYWVKKKGAWAKKTTPMKKHLFYPRALRHAEPNIYFTAGILSVLTEQCPHLDEAFDSVPHRHPVSHFYWGDLVRGTDAEDRVLLARRRLLGYYLKTPAQTRTWRGLTIRSPLDGALRKVTSKMDDNRDGGRRRHKGIDFASDRGEPVRAIADGVVSFAGAQKKDVTLNLRPKEAGKLRPADFGRGGLIVMVKHDDEVSSAYMHLERYVVQHRQKVKRGDLLGYVGRSGVKDSAAHLHFEVRVRRKKKTDKARIDPLPVLGKLVISPMETHRGQRLHAEERRQRKRRRR